MRRLRLHPTEPATSCACCLWSFSFQGQWDGDCTLVGHNVRVHVTTFSFLALKILRSALPSDFQSVGQTLFCKNGVTTLVRPHSCSMIF